MDTFELPFFHGVLKNAFNNDLMEKCFSEMQNLNYSTNSNDMYHFKQATFDMLNTQKNLKNLISKIYSSSFRQQFEHFGFDLIDKVDLSSHCYVKNDYLLCHDDKIEEGQFKRKIAFILYFNKNWQSENGGNLQLYNCDINSMPSTLDKELSPDWNTLAFFEVSSTSFHQVQRILGEQPRYSISGWFYTESTTPVPKDINENWLNPIYFKEDTQNTILETFCNQGNILLTNFLHKDLFKLIMNDLELIKWSQKGPINIKKFLVASDLPDSFKDLLCYLTLLPFKSFLNKLTGMDCRVSFNQSIRKFEVESFIMLRDDQLEPVGIDIEFYLKDSDCGTEYCTMSSELLTTTPQSNSLSIVYRDEGVMRYVPVCLNERIDIVTTYTRVEAESDDDMYEE